MTQGSSARAADADEVIGQFHRVPEIDATYTVAGNADAIVMIRVDDAGHLKAAVNSLRRIRDVRGTKTLMVLEAWSRARC